MSWDNPAWRREVIQRANAAERASRGNVVRWRGPSPLQQRISGNYFETPRVRAGEWRTWPKARSWAGAEAAIEFADWARGVSRGYFDARGNSSSIRSSKRAGPAKDDWTTTDMNQGGSYDARDVPFRDDGGSRARGPKNWDQPDQPWPGMDGSEGGGGGGGGGKKHFNSKVRYEKY